MKHRPSMFLIRAVFWLTLVAVLMPHEPAAQSALRPRPGAVQGAMQMPARFDGEAALMPAVAALGGEDVPMCVPYGAACKASLNMLDHLQALAHDGFLRVRGELIAQKRQVERNRIERDTFRKI